MEQGMVLYPVLAGKIAERGIKKKAIADAMHVKNRSLYNKMNGISPFTWDEVNIIRDQFFPDMELVHLFSRKQGA